MTSTLGRAELLEQEKSLDSSLTEAKSKVCLPEPQAGRRHIPSEASSTEHVSLAENSLPSEAGQGDWRRDGAEGSSATGSGPAWKESSEPLAQEMSKDAMRTVELDSTLSSSLGCRIPESWEHHIHPGEKLMEALNALNMVVSPSLGSGVDARSGLG